MNRWVGKLAIVTGASSGIGAAITSKLIEHGVKVIGVARREDRLKALAQNLSGQKGELHPFAADITNCDELLKVFQWAKENVGLVHILVNNAGVGRKMTLSNFKIEDARATLDLNVLALTIATRETLRVFRENNIQGHIININSVSGHWVYDFPSLSIYTASKYAVTALTESTYLEIKNLKLGAKATSISPGLVETEILPKEHTEKLKRLSEYTALKPEDIANAAIYVLSTPPNCQIDELTIRPIFARE